MNDHNEVARGRDPRLARNDDDELPPDYAWLASLPDGDEAETLAEPEPVAPPSDAPATPAPEPVVIEQVSDADIASMLAALDAGDSAALATLDPRVINAPVPQYNGTTALYNATWQGNAARIYLLLAANADVNKANALNWTPLMAAAIQGNGEVIAELLQAGADTDIAADDGKTPLMAAAWNGHEAVVQQLLDNGAGVDLRSVEGWTALSYAAFRGHQSIAQALLQGGSDTSLRDNNGQTAMDIARQRGHELLAALLDTGNS